MKKKIINGILLVAMLFATTSAFVSCKDTDADYKTDTDARIAKLQSDLASLQTLVSTIKSCNCDMASVNNKLAALEAAINAISIPSLDGYVKTEDLPTAVQGLLVNYYTNAQVEDAIAKALEGYAKTSDIPAPGLTEEQVNALIIAALEEYAKNHPIPEAGLSKEEIEQLIKDAIDKIEIPTPLTAEQIQQMIDDAIDKIKIPEGGLTEDQVKNLINTALEEYAKKTDIPEVLTKAEIIQIINDILKDFVADVTAVYVTEVTSLSVDKVTNPLFEFSTPFGVNSNVLITFFGEKAKRDIFFPQGADEPLVYKGEYFLEGTGNAGKMYVTVNPSSVNFAGKTLKLVNTAGDESPVELTPLTASNAVLKYITRGDNALYETYATIPMEKLSKAYFSWEPTDMGAFKDQIITLLKNRSKEDIADMMQALSNLIAGNDVPAYRLQAAWGEGYYTYSKADIAAVALKPLTYAFDLAAEGEIIDTPISELERLETYIVNRGTKTESTRKQIWRWLNKFNRETNRWLNNINWALQPTLFIDCDNEISRPGVNDYVAYKAGEIKLIPTSWTVELLAPAYKKYVVVTSVDGKEVTPDDPVNASELLGKVIPGSVNQIPFTIEAGKSYTIQYSALDYEGNTRTLNYYIKGK